MSSYVREPIYQIFHEDSPVLVVIFLIKTSMITKKIVGLTLYSFSAVLVIISILVFIIGYSINSFLIIEGSNQTATEERNITNFNSISTNSSFDIILKKSEQEKVTVIAESNLISRIKTYKKDSKLIIELEKLFPYINPITIKNKLPIKVLVEYKDLKMIIQDGSGHVTSFENEKLETDQLSLILNGTGEINLNLEVEHLKSSLAGSGYMRLQGNSRIHEASLTGSGEINSTTLETIESEVQLIGSGNIKLNSRKVLNVDINGSGKVIYYGQPESFEQNIVGTGIIEQQN